jgi:hypothetical protein
MLAEAAIFHALPVSEPIWSFMSCLFESRIIHVLNYFIRIREGNYIKMQFKETGLWVVGWKHLALIAQ